MNKIPIYKEKLIPVKNDENFSALINSKNGLIESFESNNFTTSKFTYHYVWNLIDNLDEGIVIHYPNTFFKDENTYKGEYNDKEDSFTQYYRKIK